MKKALTTITLATVMAFGSTFTFANGGIVITDGLANNSCETDKTGIVITDGATGIVITDLIGIMVSDLFGTKDEGCSETQNTGIMVSD